MLFAYEVYIIAKNIKNYPLFFYLKIKGNLQARMYFTMCNHHNLHWLDFIVYCIS